MDRTQRGMTLIELMIAVVIIGILAAVAIFAYNRYVKKAKSSEVPAVFAEFKLREEQYHTENGTYLSTGADENSKHPATPAGGTDPQDITVGWPATWDTLRINTDKTYLYCSYVAIAGNAGVAPSGAQATFFGFTAAPPTNWFYLLAECDWDDNDTTNSFYFARSDLDGIAKRDEGN